MVRNTNFHSGALRMAHQVKLANGRIRGNHKHYWTWHRSRHELVYVYSQSSTCTNLSGLLFLACSSFSNCSCSRFIPDVSPMFLYFADETWWLNQIVMFSKSKLATYVLSTGVTCAIGNKSYFWYPIQRQLPSHPNQPWDDPLGPVLWQVRVTTPLCQT